MAHALADSTFAQFADSTGEQLDAALVVADIRRLQTATNKILEHGDRVVAHDDKRGASSATFDDLNVAIEAIEEITKRYVLLLTGESLLEMTPIDVSNSISAFRFAWIDPDHPPDLGSRAS